MNWICDCCSSVNEERETECFVCGTPRSAASIREAARRAREERRENRLRTACKYLSGTGKVLFIAAVSVLALTFLLILFFKVKDGELGDIVYALIAVAKRTGASIRDAFAVQLVAALQRVPPSLADFGKNLWTVLKKAAESIRLDLGGIGAEVFVTRNAKFKHFSGVTVAVKDRVVAAFVYWWAVLTTLLPQCFEAVKGIPHNVRAIALKIKELFAQF